MARIMSLLRASTTYHLSDDIAMDAIKWLREQKAYAPDKPFFMYWAPGAAHHRSTPPEVLRGNWQGPCIPLPYLPFSRSCPA